MMRRAVAVATMGLLILSACSKDEYDDNEFTVAKEIYNLPGDTLFPEGIAYQNKTGHFYTGSTTSGDIIKVDVETGDASIWSPGVTQGRRFTTGLKFDDNRHLWVCGGEEGKISVLDENGASIKVWDLKTMFGAGFINDCISDGTFMYFTDSRVQKIYRARIEAAPNTMEEWLTFTNDQIPFVTGTNANGIVTTPNNDFLIVVVSTSGKLYRINTSSKEIRELPLNATVQGGDGMVLDGNTLYVSRNAQNTIVPVQLSNAFDAGTVGAGFGTNLSFNTTMVKVDSYLLVVNGQLNKRANRTHTLPFTVSRVAIPD